MAVGEAVELVLIAPGVCYHWLPSQQASPDRGRSLAFFPARSLLLASFPARRSPATPFLSC